VSYQYVPRGPVEAPRGVRCGEGVSLSPLREGSGRKFFVDFSVKNGTFWCILGAIFADSSNLKLYRTVNDSR